MWFPTALAGFSFLLFNLLDSPCLAAISTMAQQMQDRKWFWFAILFQNVFAYAVTLCVYQIGSFLFYGSFGAGTVVAFVVLLFMLYMLFRPDPYKDQKTYSKYSPRHNERRRKTSVGILNRHNKGAGWKHPVPFLKLHDCGKMNMADIHCFMFPLRKKGIL